MKISVNAILNDGDVVLEKLKKFVVDQHLQSGDFVEFDMSRAASIQYRVMSILMNELHEIYASNQEFTKMYYEFSVTYTNHGIGGIFSKISERPIPEQMLFARMCQELTKISGEFDASTSSDVGC